METLVETIMKKDGTVCPWCGNNMSYRGSKRNGKMFCIKCAFEIDAAAGSVLEEIKRRKEELENMRSNYLVKEENLRRLCTAVSISSMKIQTHAEE